MLSIEDLVFAYNPGDRPVIHGLSHSFQHGTVTAIVGRSGTGKSTLLYLLGLMLSPTSGRITISGKPAPRSDRRRSLLRAQHIGFVFQDAILDEARTVVDNVMEGALYAGIPRRTALPRAEELLTQFEVDLRSEARPGEVSGGQAQRVALCRALLKKPTLLLADEPTGNLDQESSHVVWSALQAHGESGGIVVVATHDTELAGRCDETLTL